MNRLEHTANISDYYIYNKLTKLAVKGAGRAFFARGAFVGASGRAAWRRAAERIPRAGANGILHPTRPCQTRGAAL